MNSEKVKEIKKALEQNDDNGIMYEVNDQKRTCKFIRHKDILTLINELESENERLSKERDKYIIENKDIEESNTYANKFLENYKEENQQLKYRIAELEKEKTKQLKQFTEMLKKISAYSFIFGKKFIVEKDIDETLKEFINE